MEFKHNSPVEPVSKPRIFPKCRPHHPIPCQPYILNSHAYSCSCQKLIELLHSWANIGGAATKNSQRSSSVAPSTMMRNNSQIRMSRRKGRRGFRFSEAIARFGYIVTTDGTGSKRKPDFFVLPFTHCPLGKYPAE